MDKGFTLPIGFAVMVVLPLVGVLSIFSLSFTALHPTEASIKDTIKVSPAKVEWESLSESTFSAPVATSVSTATAVQNPINPGASAQYAFTTPSVLQNGVDEIVITFDNEYGVPSGISENLISIIADDVTGGGTPNQAISPEAVNVAFVSFRGKANDELELTLRVPDMDTSVSSGGNGIASGALVTVIFSQLAGLTNPTESGSDPIDIRTTQDIDDVEALNPTTNATVFTPLRIEMSSTSDPRGE